MKAETILPLFDGFYGTHYANAIDSEIESIIEGENSENGTDLNYDDYEFNIDYVGFSKKIAEHLFDYIKEAYPILVNGFVFQDLYQPREYNFSTDEIQIELDFNKDALLDIMTEHSAMLDEKIKDKFTSCSGFVSFVSNQYSEWLEAMVNYDENDDYSPIMVAHIIQFVLEDEFRDEEHIYSILEKIEISEFVDFKQNNEK